MDEKVRIKIEKFLGKLKDIFGERIRSCILYGSCVKGNYREGFSDINIIVVLDKFEKNEIYKIKDKIVKYARKNFIRPFFFSEWFLLSSSDVFPIEWLDIKENHIILYGEDITKNIEIKKENLRLEIERKLKQLYLDFQTALIFEKKNTELIKEVLKNLKFLIPLIKKELGEKVSFPEIFDEFLNKSRYRKKEIDEITEMIFKFFENLILMVDEIKT